MPRVTKRRQLIAAEDVPTVFNDACIRRLATIAKSPPNADIAAWAEGIRDAARIFARETREPSDNALHQEIATLYAAADQRRYDRLQVLFANRTPRARRMLDDRAARPSVRIELPAPDALRDPERRDAACEAIARLCRIGGKIIKGRRRPGGKRSRPAFRPLFHAPEPRPHFPKRQAERNFVMLLQIAWLDTTGMKPAPTARHGSLGPFGRFAQECLRLVGAVDADVVELINELNRQRRDQRVQMAKRRRAERKAKSSLSRNNP
jgi:hypothetical protein